MRAWGSSREEERDIRKVESHPWPRNDGAQCSIATPRRGEAEEHEGMEAEG